MYILYINSNGRESTTRKGPNMITTPKAPKTRSTNVNTPTGAIISAKVTFGPFSRYAVYAIWTRFWTIEWIVTDAEQVDPVTDGPAIIRQDPDFDVAVKGLV